jgi:hypothetical protein
MRLWALLPFLAVALALAGPPAFAQPATPPGQERSEEAKRNKDEKKAAQEAKKEAKKDEPDDPGDGGGDGGDEDDGDGGEGDGGGDEGDDEDQGEPGEEPDGGASGGHGGSGGQGSGGGERSTDGSGSADEGRRSPLVDDVACVDGCMSAQDGAARERDGIRAATGGLSVLEEAVTSAAAVEVVEGIPSRSGALGPAKAVNGNPAVLALLTVSTFLLLVGLVGGLRALHGLGEG